MPRIGCQGATRSIGAATLGFAGLHHARGGHAHGDVVEFGQLAPGLVGLPSRLLAFAELFHDLALLGGFGKGLLGVVDLPLEQRHALEERGRLALDGKHVSPVAREKADVELAQEPVLAKVVHAALDGLIDLLQRRLMLLHVGLEARQVTLLFLLDVRPVPQNCFQRELEFRHSSVLLVPSPL